MKKSLRLACIFFFIAKVCISIHFEQNSLNLNSLGSNLPYQAHSFNDLDYTRHLLLKQTKYFKFDISLANRESCKSYSTWNTTNKCFNSSFYSEEICCIAMRGDAGSENDFKWPFNTTQEFILLFDNFLKINEGRFDILFVAIDFQFSFQFRNFLMENFVYELTALMQKYKKLHISIGHDFILEYDRICKTAGEVNALNEEQDKLNMGEQACSQRRKFISAGRMVLQSSAESNFDPKDIHKRIRQFNIIYKEIPRLCQNKFPNWINNYPQYPLIFWEPSNQDQIQRSLALLMSPSCIRKHNRTIKGIAFASNIDPEMFQSYMNPKLFYDHVQDLHLTKLTPKPNLWKLIVAGRRINQNVSMITSYAYNQQKDEIYPERSINFPEILDQIHGLADKAIIITTKNKANADKDLNGGFLKSRNVKFWLLDSNLTQIMNVELDDFVIACTNYADEMYAITGTVNPTFFNIVVISKDLKSIVNYGNFVLEIEKSKQITSFLFKKGASKSQDFILLSGNNGKQTWIAQLKSNNIYKIRSLTYGVESKIILREDGQISILLQNSYCHSGILLNNNAQNKCLLHKSEALNKLAALPGLVNILVTSIDNLKQFLEDPNELNIITACHPKIKFSKLLNGKNTDLISYANKIIISSDYLALVDQDIMLSMFSGGSNYDLKLNNATTSFIYAIQSANGLATNEVLLEM